MQVGLWDAGRPRMQVRLLDAGTAQEAGKALDAGKVISELERQVGGG
jgi:hypothetical protein